MLWWWPGDDGLVYIEALLVFKSRPWWHREEGGGLLLSRNTPPAYPRIRIFGCAFLHKVEEETTPTGYRHLMCVLFFVMLPIARTLLLPSEFYSVRHAEMQVPMFSYLKLFLIRWSALHFFAISRCYILFMQSRARETTSLSREISGYQMTIACSPSCHKAWNSFQVFFFCFGYNAGSWMK